METGRANRFPNCLKFRKAEARETLIQSLAFVLMIQVNISRHTAFLSAQDNEPSVPRADPPLALPQNPFDFLPYSLYDRRKTKEGLL